MKLKTEIFLLYFPPSPFPTTFFSCESQISGFHMTLFPLMGSVFSHFFLFSPALSLPCFLVLCFPSLDRLVHFVMLFFSAHLFLVCFWFPALLWQLYAKLTLFHAYVSSVNNYCTPWSKKSSCGTFWISVRLFLRMSSFVKNIIMNDGLVQISKPDSWVQQHLFGDILVLLGTLGRD